MKKKQYTRTNKTHWKKVFKIVNFLSQYSVKIPNGIHILQLNKENLKYVFLNIANKTF